MHKHKQQKVLVLAALMLATTMSATLMLALCALHCTDLPLLLLLLPHAEGLLLAGRLVAEEPEGEVCVELSSVIVQLGPSLAAWATRPVVKLAAFPHPAGVNAGTKGFMQGCRRVTRPTGLCAGEIPDGEIGAFAAENLHNQGTCAAQFKPQRWLDSLAEEAGLRARIPRGCICIGISWLTCPGDRPWEC